jgi:hypothetical protein
MAWESLPRKTSNGGTTGIKFTNEPGDRPRTKVRIGYDAVEFLDIKSGSFVEVLFDLQFKKIALRKTTAEKGFQVGGKYKSKTISFATPKNKFLSLLLLAYDKEWKFTKDGKTAVIDLT